MQFTPSPLILKQNVNYAKNVRLGEDFYFIYFIFELTQGKMFLKYQPMSKNEF